MRRFFPGNLLGKLLLLMSVLTLVPTVVVSWLTFTQAETIVKNEVYSKLSAAHVLRERQLCEYLVDTQHALRTLSVGSDVRQAFVKLAEFESNAAPSSRVNVGQPAYQALRAQLQPYFAQFVKAQGAHDLMLVCPQHGHVLYTVAGEDDLGANLSDASFRDAGLAEVWQRVRDEGRPVLSDLSYYAPSKDVAAFMAAPCQAADGSPLGVVVLQLGTARLAQAIEGTTWMNKTGEISLVGADKLLRATSRQGAESDILKLKIDTAATRAALEQGKEGTEVVLDHRGVETLCAYSPVAMPAELGARCKWAILAAMDTREAFAELHKLELTVAGIAALVGVLAILIGIWATRRVALPIRAVSGDLARGGEQVATAVAEMSASIAEVTATANETAASSTETNATMAELKQTAEVSNHRAATVADSARGAANAAESGRAATQAIIDQMNAIRQQMDAIGESVVNLSRQNKAIGEIIDSVEDLAEQSNLLAVNAAVEAARAGDEGRGFAVVAQEIKSLAQQSKESTKRIRAILDDVQQATAATVMAAERGAKAVEVGNQCTGEANHAIQALAGSVDEAAEAAVQIAATSQQQLAGIEQVAVAMQSISQATTQNVATMQQLKKAADSLNELGRSLVTLVARNERISGKSA